MFIFIILWYLYIIYYIDYIYIYLLSIFYFYIILNNNIKFIILLIYIKTIFTNKWIGFICIVVYFYINFYVEFPLEILQCAEVFLPLEGASCSAWHTEVPRWFSMHKAFQHQRGNHFNSRISLSALKKSASLVSIKLSNGRFKSTHFRLLGCSLVLGDLFTRLSFHFRWTVTVHTEEESYF